MITLREGSERQWRSFRTARNGVESRVPVAHVWRRPKRSGVRKADMEVYRGIVFETGRRWTAVQPDRTGGTPPNGTSGNIYVLELA